MKSLKDFWETSKYTNLCIMGVPEEEKKEKGTERIFEEIIAKNSPNLKKDIDVHIQVYQQIPSRIKLKRRTPRHIIIKLSKDKEKILK